MLAQIVLVDVSRCFRHAVEVAPEHLVRLGQYIMARRAACGYRHRIDLANDMDLTDRTLADIENGVRVASPGTYALIENALDWRPGSIASILEGGEPTETASPRSPLELASDDALLAEIRRRMAVARGVSRSKQSDDSAGWPAAYLPDGSGMFWDEDDMQRHQRRG